MGGTIYVLAGGKGGVGRTTTALNTGIALERAGYNTAVVDGDVAMTGLSELVDAEPAGGVHDVVAGTDSINDAVVDGPDGVTVVAGNRSLEAVTSVDSATLGRVVEPLAAAHDVVLVDTPPGLRPLHRDAYGRADGTVLVTTPGVGAVASAERTARAVDHVGGEVLGVAVTKADRQAARAVVDDIDATPLAVVPDDSGLAQDPLAETGPAADAFARLADAVGSHADGEPVEPVDLPDTVDTSGDATAEETEVTEPDDAAAAVAGETVIQNDGVESETAEDPLDRLFAEEYTATADDDSGLGEQIAARLDGIEGTERLRERLRNARSSDRNPVELLRERLDDEDGIEDRETTIRKALEEESGEDPLEALLKKNS